MPRIVKISIPKRYPNRRRIQWDDRPAMLVADSVVARFDLQPGLSLTDEQIGRIGNAQDERECVKAALGFLKRRAHSRAELAVKLSRHGRPASVITSALAELARLGYVNDEQFARAKAETALRRHHGRRRAQADLFRSGVRGQVAEKAISQIYDNADQSAVARELAREYAPRLRRLDPPVARRRLVGMLLRRGFDYDTIRPVLDEALGPTAE